MKNKKTTFQIQMQNNKILILFKIKKWIWNKTMKMKKIKWTMKKKLKYRKIL